MNAMHRGQVDEEQFAEMFHRYKNLVLKTAYLILGSAQEADDVLQDVFLKVHGSLHTYDASKGAITTWLYRITVNQCLNRKRGWRMITISLGEHLRSHALHVPSAEGRIDDEQAMIAVLGGLSEKLRAVVVLRYYADLPLNEIADVLDIPLGTVKSRLNKALDVLRRRIEAAPLESAQTRELQHEVQ
jgi:RNA polymerase sigma-70 factor, ECF subfamily